MTRAHAAIVAFLTLAGGIAIGLFYGVTVYHRSEEPAIPAPLEPDRVGIVTLYSGGQAVSRHFVSGQITTWSNQIRFDTHGTRITWSGAWMVASRPLQDDKVRDLNGLPVDIVIE